MLTHLSRCTLLVAAAGLALSGRAAADPTPLVDAAVEGTGALVTKAYFFRGDLVIRYDWGKDRVDDGYPQAIRTMIPEEPFARGIDAGSVTFGSPFMVLIRGRDWLVGPLAGPRDVSLGDDGTPPVDSTIHGLGPSATIEFLFEGDQVRAADSRIDRAGPADAEPTAARLKLPPDIAGRIDAAVNGAGNFIGYGYFFQGDRYVKYDWAAGRPAGAAKKIQPNFPGLVELLAVADGLTTARPWTATALAWLNADLARARNEEPVPDDAAGRALRAHLKLVTPAERRAALPGLIKQLELATPVLVSGRPTLRFRTAAEAKADTGAPDEAGRGIYDLAGWINVSPALLRVPAECRAGRVAWAAIKVARPIASDRAGALGRFVMHAGRNSDVNPCP